MSIEMNLAGEPFEMIKCGIKTVEIRLYDEKRRQIKIGDKITFYRSGDKPDSITATVEALYRFDSFKEVFLSELFPNTGCGNLTVEEAVESMYRYYTKQQERQYGVLCIGLQNRR